MTAAPAGGRVVKAEEIDAAKGVAPTVRGEQVAKMIERLEHLEVSETRGRNAWMSEGYPEPQLSARLTVEKLPARAAGTLPEARALTESYKLQVVTGMVSPTMKEDSPPRDAATPVL